MDAEQLADIRAILGRGMSLYRADQKALLDEIERLNATIQRVRDVIGGPCHPWFHADEIIEALEGGEAS